MSIGIPSKPVMPKGESQELDAKGNRLLTEEQQLEYNNKMQAYWFALQQEQNRQTQEATAKSNIAKASHDAIMAMVNNTKS